jgi:hypothetical protein
MTFDSFSFNNGSIKTVFVKVWIGGLHQQCWALESARNAYTWARKGSCISLQTAIDVAWLA